MSMIPDSTVASPIKTKAEERRDVWEENDSQQTRWKNHLQNSDKTKKDTWSCGIIGHIDHPRDPNTCPHPDQKKQAFTPTKPSSKINKSGNRIVIRPQILLHRRRWWRCWKSRQWCQFISNRWIHFIVTMSFIVISYLDQDSDFDSQCLYMCFGCFRIDKIIVKLSFLQLIYDQRLDCEIERLF